MWLSLLAQEHGPEIDPTNLFEPANPKAAIWAWAIFVVLLVVLWKFAWGPIAKGLEAREHRIAESLKKAEELEKATRELTETNKRVLDAARVEAQQIVADARAAATKAAQAIADKAAHEVEQQREHFTRETQLAVEKARADLRTDTVNLTLEVAARLLGKTLTDADHRRLATEALADAERVARN